ncbi:MAG: hypothetical protein ACRDTU_16625 [Micromonosporaceae bacterium]
MRPDDYGPSKDLTPGDFHVMEGTVDVKTDSLYSFSQSYFKDVMAFEINSAMPMTFMTLNAHGDGDGAIGKDEKLYEASGLALRMKLASQDAETLTRDLVYGNKALVNVAMVMSEQYNGTDGWNAANTANAVNDAFNPPASGKSLADVRADEDAERTRVQNLPVVHPSDVHLYNMATNPDGSPMVAGKDYIIAGSEGTGPTMTPGTNVQQDNPATKDKDESEEQNPYFTVPVSEVEAPDSYVPPPPVDPNDANALRYNDDGSPAPTLGQVAEEAQEEPGVVSAYVNDNGEIVRVHEPSSYGSYGGSSTYTTTSPNPYADGQ